MHFSTATIACALPLLAAAFEFPDFVPLHKRQEPGTPAYECHANCGGVITISRTDGFCDTSDFTTKFNACMACAVEYDIWQYYGSSVTRAAETCGVEVNLSSSASAEATTAAPSTSAAATVVATTESSEAPEATSSAAPASTTIESSAAPSTTAVTSSAAAESSSVETSSTSAAASVGVSTSACYGAAFTRTWKEGIGIPQRSPHQETKKSLHVTRHVIPHQDPHVALRSPGDIKQLSPSVAPAT